jgi:hypothetical protein
MEMFVSTPTITIDTATLELNPLTFGMELKFSGLLEFDHYNGDGVSSEIDNDTALIIARELITQIKILSALTSDMGG